MTRSPSLDEHVIYDTLLASARRLVNQAVFLALVVSGSDSAQAQRIARACSLGRAAWLAGEIAEAPCGQGMNFGRIPRFCWQFRPARAQ